MENQERKPCDPDDAVCQMEVLRHLEGLQQQLGNDAFLEKYPEAASLREKLPEEIRKQRVTVDESLDGCAGGQGDPRNFMEPSAEDVAATEEASEEAAAMAELEEDDGD